MSSINPAIPVGEERKAIESRGDTRRRYSLYAFVGILLPMMAWGLFVRFDGLESRPLSVDEYYSVTGVQYILEKGVPVFPTGGYYLRAWSLQYLQGRVRPPEARAANMLLFGRSRGLANLPNDVSTCRTGAVIDHGAREDRRATTAISVEKVMDTVLAQLDALAVSAR